MAELTEEIPWGRVIVGDTVISEDKRKWDVTCIADDPDSKYRTMITMELLGAEDADPVTGKPKKTDLVRIRQRKQVPLSEALGVLSAAFPDATINARDLPDYIVCGRCGAIVATSHEPLHVEHHATVDAQLNRLMRVLSDAECDVSEHES
jgi:hypothetical protein